MDMSATANATSIENRFRTYIGWFKLVVDNLNAEWDSMSPTTKVASAPTRNEYLAKLHSPEATFWNWVSDEGLDTVEAMSAFTNLFIEEQWRYE